MSKAGQYSLGPWMNIADHGDLMSLLLIVGMVDGEYIVLSIVAALTSTLPLCIFQQVFTVLVSKVRSQ